MRRRFFWSMVGVAGLTLVLLVGLAAIVSQRAQQNAAEQSLRAVTGAVSEEITELLASDTPPRELGDRAEVRRVLEQARRSSNSDIGLILRTSRQATAFGAPPQFVELFGSDPDVEVGGVTVFEVDGGLAVARSVPLQRAEGDILIIAARRSPVVQWDNQVRTVLIGLIVAGIVAAVTARLLSGWVASRVDPLAGGAARLRHGDLSARVPVDGSDELTSVAVSFNEMAEALEQSKERERQFLLSVGHDLRTPLTTIGGYVEALEDGVDDPEELSRIASVMGSEHRRLRRLIEDVMVLARLDNAEFGVATEPVDVTAHVEEVVSRYAASAESSSIGLHTSLDQTGVRAVDPDRIAQILSNLIENALRYTPADGSVVVRLRGRPDRVDVEVSDTGPGIETADLPHIFERFYVARKYRGVRPEGSGLGLSIVERLVTSMGGRVSATSQLGLGTVFLVELPAPPAPVPT